ncbi:DUF3298 and DUF4163 domain-containing protein [Dyadobacter sp. UC 10]|nr:DUF3298 and DUF4163 domain-containing protein [Dyadobacter sp. UC 10]
MQIRNLIIMLVTIAIYSCNPAAKNDNQEEANTLVKGKVIKAAFGQCDTLGNGKGATVRVEIWEPTDSGKVAGTMRSILDEKLISRVNQHGDSASISKTPAALKSIGGAFAVFEKNYNDFKKDFPDAPGCWEVELKGDTVMATPKVLFYQLDHYAFTGGAHPNTFRSFHAFSAADGKEIEMQDFVADSSALLKLVEQHFRKTEKLSADADLEEAGYFLLNHRFALPVNYVFTQQGVLFYYNPYEIAAYARGVIKFTIPYQELGDIVRKSEVF